MELSKSRFVKPLQQSLPKQTINTRASASCCEGVRKTDGSSLTVRPDRCDWTLVRRGKCKKNLGPNEIEHAACLPNAFMKAAFSNVEHLVHGCVHFLGAACRRRHVKCETQLSRQFLSFLPFPQKQNDYESGFKAIPKIFTAQVLVLRSLSLSLSHTYPQAHT